MKVAIINMTTLGSTGHIMFQLCSASYKNGFEALSYSPCPLSNKHERKLLNICGHKYYSDRIERKLDNIIGRIFGLNGCTTFLGSKELICSLSNNKSNILHLHNLHGYCINLPLLFRYIKRRNIPVIWTLHDCWSFTGHCPHFTMVKCEKWKTGCHHCPSYREYPQSLMDNSKLMWKLKKKWFTGVENMTIVTPSQWLADLVKQSYLKDYPVKVIHNGIDLSVFRPVPSDFRERYAIPDDRFILLGVAFGWGGRKGLDVFLELSKRLDAERFQIVLVGTDDATDRQLPETIISIHRTQNQRELAEIYSAADLFVNPTREENYPTVNMESIACGIPVLTFRTGGSPEIPDETCGAVVDCDDVDAMEREIVRICETKPFSKEACLQRAKAFDMNDRFQEYVNLYQEILQ